MAERDFYYAHTAKFSVSVCQYIRQDWLLLRRRTRSVFRNLPTDQDRLTGVIPSLPRISTTRLLRLPGVEVTIRGSGRSETSHDLAETPDRSPGYPYARSGAISVLLALEPWMQSDLLRSILALREPTKKDKLTALKEKQKPRGICHMPLGERGLRPNDVDK